MYRSQSGDHMVQRALLVSSSGWHRVSVIWFGLVLSLETRRGGAGLSSIPVAYVVRGLYFVAGRRSVASRDRPSPRCAVYFLCLPIDDAPHAWFILILVS